MSSVASSSSSSSKRRRRRSSNDKSNKKSVDVKKSNKKKSNSSVRKTTTTTSNNKRRAKRVTQKSLSTSLSPLSKTRSKKKDKVSLPPTIIRKRKRKRNSSSLSTSAQDRSLKLKVRKTIKQYHQNPDKNHINLSTLSHYVRILGDKHKKDIYDNLYENDDKELSEGYDKVNWQAEALKLIRDQTEKILVNEILSPSFIFTLWKGRSTLKSDVIRLVQLLSKSKWNENKDSDGSVNSLFNNINNGNVDVIELSQQQTSPPSTKVKKEKDKKRKLDPPTSSELSDDDDNDYKSFDDENDNKKVSEDDNDDSTNFDDDLDDDDFD